MKINIFLLAVISTISFLSARSRTKKYSLDFFDVFKNPQRYEALRKIIWEGHMGPISQAAYGNVNKFSLSIRETGIYSIIRIQEGAKAKPHTILEKSIKESSLKSVYGDNWQNDPNVLNFFSSLSGFAGHYGQLNGKKELLGVRCDNASAYFRSIAKVYDCRTPENIAEPYCEFVARDSAIALINDPINKSNFIKELYTGDYDIHEIYNNRNSIIPESSIEKLNALNALNSAICQTPNYLGERCGVFEIDKNKKTIHMTKKDSLNPQDSRSYWAMFQHGDQATYKMNQHLEYGAMGGKGIKAVVVKAVHEESNDPLAWCYRGTWFVTLNQREHSIFRSLTLLIAPNHWYNLGSSKSSRAASIIVKKKKFRKN
jgi:hypothetical protein